MLAVYQADKMPINSYVELINIARILNIITLLHLAYANYNNKVLFNIALICIICIYREIRGGPRVDISEMSCNESTTRYKVMSFVI